MRQSIVFFFKKSCVRYGFRYYYHQLYLRVPNCISSAIWIRLVVNFSISAPLIFFDFELALNLLAIPFSRQYPPIGETPIMAARYIAAIDPSNYVIARHLAISCMVRHSAQSAAALLHGASSVRSCFVGIIE